MLGFVEMVVFLIVVFGLPVVLIVVRILLFLFSSARPWTIWKSIELAQQSRGRVLPEQEVRKKRNRYLMFKTNEEAKVFLGTVDPDRDPRMIPYENGTYRYIVYWAPLSQAVRDILKRSEDRLG